MSNILLATNPKPEKREPGNFDNYTKNEGRGWRCKDCKSMIFSGIVAHPIWLRGTKGGFGKCKYEEVPYCSNCEKEPNCNGEPVYIDFDINNFNLRF